ncbi:esterase/lipase family protein [Pseudomonadota bacterium]
MTSPHNSAIVFVHGICGFSSFRLLGKEIQYFRALKTSLRDCPIPIHFSALPTTGTIQQRATFLANYLAQIPEQKIHLIAHSMGGLDSRYTICRLDPKRCIQTLTTIATPHRGSPLAEWFANTPGLIPALGRRIAAPGLYELTPDACTLFNYKNPNRSDVTYQSYAGVRTPSEIPMLFRPWANMVEQCVGENDSQVAKSSAIWGEFQGTLQADHFELVGWSFGLPNSTIKRPFDHITFYRNLIKHLTS